MHREAFEHHLTSEERWGFNGRAAPVGSAGGFACGDLVAIALRLGDGNIVEARFKAEGCGAARAAGSAAASLAEGAAVLSTARLTAGDIEAELGGLTIAKRHAAELAEEALQRALTRAVLAAGAPVVAPREDRVVVALSGGVDSAAAALTLRDEGLDVVAVTLELWSDPGTDGERACCSPQAVRAARALARSLDLPHFTLDLREAFRAKVVDTYLAEHAAGRTPNPCVLCNGSVRFDEMLAFADCLGASTLATGHYARIVDDGAGPLIRAGANARKDQAYMLAAVEPDLANRLRFPVGRLGKDEVRALARRAGLVVAGKPESQDLCFVAGTERSDFLARHGGAPGAPGEIVDRTGHVLGRHRGHQHFTVGQRKGLGVSATEPLYVLEKDARANRVVVGRRSELAAGRVRVAPAILYRDAARVSAAKLRYRSPATAARVEGKLDSGRHDELILRLSEPVHGIAPGQVACLYDDDLVVGWGIIKA